MSFVETSPIASLEYQTVVARRPWWRAAALGLLLLLTLILYFFMRAVAPPDTIADNYLSKPFLNLWMLAFLPYFAACALVLATKPAQGRWRWIELSVILTGAALLRVILLPLPPGFSRDSWRYLWDARVTLHGFSPYVYNPFDPALKPLADTILLPRMRFRTVPTIYPPGAQAIFLLSYVLGGSSLYFLKGIFLIFDMITCGALAMLLHRRRLDLSRVLIYAWCPLPIVEFAMNGHVDVITLTFSLLALLSFSNKSVGGRILTGFLIGMAALTKIYPILLLVVIVPDMLRDAMERHTSTAGVAMPRAVVTWLRHIKGRDYALLATCFLTILLGYLPYYIMGHGQVLGYFSIYTGEQGENAGFIQLVMQWFSYAQRWSLPTAVMRQHIVSLLIIIAVTVTVFVLRLRRSISMEMATLALFGAILAVSTHVFPWYNTILLVWVPVLIGPLWTGRGISGRGLVIGVVWYFICVSLIEYLYTSGPHDYVPNWTSYYQVAYIPVVLALAIAAVVGVRNKLSMRARDL